MVDYHVHTKRCGHANGRDREYVETAIRKGLKEIGFSDHIPRFYQTENGKRLTERGMARTDLDEYVASVIDLKAAYPEISIKLGVEADFALGWEEELNKLLTPYPWDYVMGSVHFIPQWDYGYVAHYKEHNPEEIFSNYFEQVALAAKSKLFDVLGHIDLPRRFFPLLAETRMNELYQALAIRLGKVNAVVELNTYGVRSSKQGDVGVFPAEPLLRLCRQYGVHVTIGSDAHTPQDVGSHFDRVIESLLAVGYDQIITFTKRHPSLIQWEF